MSIVLYELVGSDPARPFSPHCWKVVMALAHKGLAFTRQPAPFTKVPTLEGGVSKTVPILRDGDRVIADSFTIAEYLEDTYPERPSLFAGQGGRAEARFVERWTQFVVQAQIVTSIVKDIHDRLDPADQAYFAETRQKRFGRPLAEVVDGRGERLAAFRASLEPLRSTLSFQPFIGGAAPLFADYIVFGAFQWARVTSPFALLAPDDPVAAWLDRCLALHDGIGARVPAAA
jgi:glutathione S-transferase